MKRSVAVILALAALALAGCGYHATTQADRLPTSVKTIAVPAFVNQTQTYRIETALTTAVVREFLSRSRFEVKNEEDASADATLRGFVLSTQLAPLTYDPQSGRASSAMVTVSMRVTLTGRDGRVLFENPNYVFREQYQVSRELSSFFEEESPAVDRLSRDFARSLVSDVMEAF